MKRQSLLACVDFLVARLPITSGEWAITGGASLQLRGVECDAKDIDILASPEVANYAAMALSDCTLKPLAITQSDDIRSLFAQYDVDGVIVEIMANVHNRLANDSWFPHREWRNHIEILQLDNTRVPVLTLDYEERIAEMLRQDERRTMIQARNGNRGRSRAERAATALASS